MATRLARRTLFVLEGSFPPSNRLTAANEIHSLSAGAFATGDMEGVLMTRVSRVGTVSLTLLICAVPRDPGCSPPKNLDKVSAQIRAICTTLPATLRDTPRGVDRPNIVARIARVSGVAGIARFARIRPPSWPPETAPDSPLLRPDREPTRGPRDPPPAPWSRFRQHMVDTTVATVPNPSRGL